MVELIKKEKPAVVFAPHVETSTGIILPENYITKVAEAVHSHGGLFVLDCIASGTVWVDMKKTGVDCILSAPQKGTCCAFPKSRHTVCPYKTDTLFYPSQDGPARRARR